MVRSRRAAIYLSLVALVSLSTPGQLPAQVASNGFTNLQVLPTDIPRDSLFGLMEGFTEALGVGCSFCHAREGGFASDANPTKRTARAMISMVQHINAERLGRLETRLDPPIRVECATCHRGTNAPRMIDDLLLATYQAAGLDSTIAAYRRLRDEYYGGYTYNFDVEALADVAWRVFLMGGFADAERLLELNVEIHPDREDARWGHVALVISRAYIEGGPEQGDSVYYALKSADRHGLFVEPLLNDVGYALLELGQHDAAIAAFGLNVREYPDAFNTYDSLGEAYMKKGETGPAIRNYERSLELNPATGNARRMLEELRGGRAVSEGPTVKRWTRS